MQVIIKTRFPGQAPQVVEDQVTYPLTTAMLSVPGRPRCAATLLRRFLRLRHFDEGTDLYWGPQPGAGVPQPGGAVAAGGRPPGWADATGVGWVYIYALQDTSGRHDINGCAACRTGS